MSPTADGSSSRTRPEPQRPCAIADTSWIKTGKTTFPWWNGFLRGEVPFKMGLNTETAKYYIDFCAEAGIPYHSLDGLDNIAWYGGPIVPYRGPTSPGHRGTRPAGSAPLREVEGGQDSPLDALEGRQAAHGRGLPALREWGVEGVMVDFMDRDDQEMVRFTRRGQEGRRQPADDHPAQLPRTDRPGANLSEPPDLRRRC